MDNCRPGLPVAILAWYHFRVPLGQIQTSHLWTLAVKELVCGSGRAGLARERMTLFRSLPATPDCHVLVTTDLRFRQGVGCRAGAVARHSSVAACGRSRVRRAPAP